MAEIWNVQAPDGCLDCGTTERKHASRGLCARCYDRFMASRKREAAQNGATPDAEPVPAAPPDDGTAEPQGRAEERRPGSFPSPGGDHDAAPPRVDEGPLSRIRSRLGMGQPKHAAPEPAKATKEKRPAWTRARVSTADTITDAWGGLGGLLSRNPNHVPLGRYLTWQAPAAGEMLDDAVKGTIIDKRILQPIVHARARIDLLVAVLGPPGVILAIERSPQQLTVDERGNLQHPLFGILRSSIRASLPTMVPAMKKARAKEEKMNETLRDLMVEFNLPEGADPVDEVLNMMFGGFEFTPPEPPGDYDPPQAQREEVFA